MPNAAVQYPIPTLNPQPLFKELLSLYLFSLNGQRSLLPEVTKRPIDWIHGGLIGQPSAVVGGH